jgi:hypothetical protein
LYIALNTLNIAGKFNFTALSEVDITVTGINRQE